MRKPIYTMGAETLAQAIETINSTLDLERESVSDLLREIADDGSPDLDTGDIGAFVYCYERISDTAMRALLIDSDERTFSPVIVRVERDVLTFSEQDSARETVSQIMGWDDESEPDDDL